MRLRTLPCPQAFTIRLEAIIKSGLHLHQDLTIMTTTPTKVLQAAAVPL
jgi:hypothetical protein